MNRKHEGVWERTTGRTRGGGVVAIELPRESTGSAARENRTKTLAVAATRTIDATRIAATWRRVSLTHRESPPRSVSVKNGTALWPSMPADEIESGANSE